MKNYIGAYATSWWVIIFLSRMWGLVGLLRGDSLGITNDNLIIKIGNRKVELQKAQIQSIKNYSTWGAVRIHHSNSNLPELLLFSAIRFLNIITELQAAGYTVESLKSFKLDK